MWPDLAKKKFHHMNLEILMENLQTCQCWQLIQNSITSSMQQILGQTWLEAVRSDPTDSFTHPLTCLFTYASHSFSNHL